MKKFSGIIIGLLFIIGSPILINILMSIQTPWVKGEVSDWISFYGSYIGAMIGAFVAYQVMRIQIKAQEEINKKTNIINQLPYLVMLKIEIEKIVKFVELLKNLSKGENPFGPIEYSNFQNPNEINEENWKGMEFLINKNLIVELINLKEQYKQLCETLKINLEQKENEIASVNLNFEKLNRKSVKDQKDLAELKILNSKLRDLHGTFEVTVSNKKFEWTNIKNDTLLNKVNKILKIINENINDIEKIANN